MLERIRVWGQDVAPFFPPTVTAQVATEAWQLRAYYRIRRSIFAEEQALFEASDVDEHDRHATPIVALGHVAGDADDVIGVVRIYRATGDTWYGGRLGVSPGYRSRRIVGTSLIVAAVSTAHAWGCREFLATIQLRNVRYFEQHHFETIEPIEICGQPHRLMRADVSAYPARAALAADPVDGDRAASLFRRARAA
jgi:putative N-acetyltransferase (TIGR04045 family)